jgi:hypothetical protein
MQTSV